VTADDGQPLLVRLLGPVRAWRGDQELALGALQRRAVFGLLAMRANRAVSRDELVDGIWGEDPPASSVNALHGYVAGLRMALEPRRARRAPGRVLLASGPGYVLRLEAGQLDTEVFGQHLAAAHGLRAGGDLAGAARSLDAGLRLWQSTPLSGIAGRWAEIERVRLGEQRLTAIEERADVMLALGCHAEAAAQLAGLVCEHPLRERFRGQLMLALYRCGRQAEALAVFADSRRVLIEELGIEPGAELRRLHERILAADATLDPPVAPAARSVAARSAPASREQEWPVPAQLPGDVAAFTGRARELAALHRLLAADGQQASHVRARAMVISAVSGTAGVGKTALAVHWAWRVADEFPDGQLYVNLRGYDPDRPMQPADALAGFLRALGRAGQDIPPDVEERAAAYRTLLDGRRVLVVLDNAATVEQVRPLLPGSPSCLVVVTSRDSLAGLVARHGAHRIDLDSLPPEDAATLLRALIGERADAEPGAVATLAEQCARLPLALRVAAELAAANPDISIGHLIGELADEQRRLDLLDAGGDARTSVRGVFSWSYRHLPADAARAFRLAGLHPGPDLDAYAVAALTAITLDHARDVLARLAQAHLVQSARPGRYAMHDLLRSYASQLASAEDGADDRQAAMTSLFDYYLGTAASAMDALVPAERSRRPRIPPPPTAAPAMTGPAAAREWLDIERAALLAIAAHAAACGWPRHATRLAATLFRYLATGGHNAEAIALHAHALTAARELGDRAAEATTLVSLGEVEWRLGRFPQGASLYDQALALFREIGDRAGEAQVHGNLGLIAWRQGRFGQASGHYERGMAAFREIGDRIGEARALDNLGAICWRQGRYQQAADYHRRALAVFREIGDRIGEARALGNLATVCRRQGFMEQAASHLQQSLSISRQIGDRACEAEALSDLGGVCLQQGRYPQAIDNYLQALALFREIGHQASEAQALNGYGKVLLATGQPGQACIQHAAALALADQIGDTYQQACAHDGLACARHVGDDLSRARHHWQRALALYTDLDVPEAGEVSVRLAASSREELHDPEPGARRPGRCWTRQTGSPPGRPRTGPGPGPPGR
jgi:DNA-binding SARP family transcriptional activator/tetratricopeptide (TPR) repeat protein